jgi:glutathione S-transferase
MAPTSYLLWGSRLSPFTLKVEAMCRHADVPFRFLPDRGGTIENARTDLRIRRLKAGRLPVTHPAMTDLDELPLVPYLFGSGGENLYDSSAIAEWLDRHHLEGVRRLLPDEPATRFAVRLIDEYFDEMGLYMAHHNRWVVSAASNDAGRRLARELRTLVPPPLRSVLAERFSARQVRRLPYLFSVAPEGFAVQGLRSSRQPPSREGFPPTHALLDTAFVRMLKRVELLLGDRSYLLGSRFTVADASAYGQLAMNTHDGAASDLIERRAPLTFAWLQRIERGEIESPARGTRGELELDVRLGDR